MFYSISFCFDSLSKDKEVFGLYHCQLLANGHKRVTALHNLTNAWQGSVHNTAASSPGFLLRQDFKTWHKSNSRCGRSATPGRRAERGACFRAWRCSSWSRSPSARASRCRWCSCGGKSGSTASRSFPPPRDTSRRRECCLKKKLHSNNNG